MDIIIQLIVNRNIILRNYYNLYYKNNLNLC